MAAVRWPTRGTYRGEKHEVSIIDECIAGDTCRGTLHWVPSVRGRSPDSLVSSPGTCPRRRFPRGGRVHRRVPRCPLPHFRSTAGTGFRGAHPGRVRARLSAVRELVLEAFRASIGWAGRFPNAWHFQLCTKQYLGGCWAGSGQLMSLGYAACHFL